jgi:plasmid stability protein
MKSITLHNLDSALAEKLEERARERGQSLNRTAQDVLRTALGLHGKQEVDRTEAFLDLFGAWDEKDVQEFNLRVADLNRVDRADWNR